MDQMKKIILTNKQQIGFILCLLGLYTISHALSLLHPGIYWDDWVLIGIKPELVRDDFFRNGRPFFGLLHEILLHLPFTVFSYKLLIFAGYFVAAILFYHFLIKTKKIDPTEARILTCLFAILPYNAARHSIVILQYVICVNLFLTACLIWIEKKPNLPLRIILFFCLVLSMYIEAFVFLLVFLIILFHFIKIKKLTDCPEAFLSLFVFLFLRYIVHPPQDIYQTLNNIQLHNLLLSPLYILKSVKVNFISVILESFRKTLTFSAVFSLISSAYFLFIFYFLVLKKQTQQMNLKKISQLAALGFVFFCIAVFPFIVVGKAPTNNDWQTRSQFLLPVGVSFMIYYGTKLIFKTHMQNWIFLIVIFTSVHLNLIYGLEFFFDYIKQESLITNFKSEPKLKDNKTFLVKDYTEFLNARDRTYRFYEYTGLFKTAFQNESRLAYRDSEPPPKQADIEFGYMKIFYNMTDYQWSLPTHVLKINLGTLNPKHIDAGWKLLKTYFLYKLNFSDEKLYLDTIENITQISITEVNTQSSNDELGNKHTPDEKKYLFELY